MVYRGKPSAGCENCRKAKKRCDLEQPACSRCVKLKKECSGYRDVNELQIQDESAAVIEKVKKKVALAVRATEQQIAGIPTPANSESSSGSTADDTIDLPLFTSDESVHDVLPLALQFDFNDVEGPPDPTGWQVQFNPSPDDVSINYFFNRFTTRVHWAFLTPFAQFPKMDPILYDAIRACGMAALNNVTPIPRGREWARSLYGEALTRLNSDLRDPHRCTRTESLVAVSMLSYFETFTCESKQSIESWKAHINGSVQLIRMRGKQQLRTPLGRGLFRESRSQILICCIWEDIKPPEFIRDWQKELTARTVENFSIVEPGDRLASIWYDFALLRSQMRSKQISDEQALAVATQLELAMTDWAANILLKNDQFKYYDVEVDDSPYIWNGAIQVYDTTNASMPLWQIYRTVRIMLSRTQEVLVLRANMTTKECQTQIQYLKSIRRQMADEICTAVPSALGQTPPEYRQQESLLAAYSQIWPLYFAGTVALERLGTMWGKRNYGHAASVASAQVSWVLNQMDYISKEFGLHWADGIAASLRGDFAIHKNILPDVSQGTAKGLPSRTVEEDTRPYWIQNLEKNGIEPRLLMEITKVLTDSTKQVHLNWTGEYDDLTHDRAVADRHYDGNPSCRCGSGQLCSVHELNADDQALNRISDIASAFNLDDDQAANDNLRAQMLAGLQDDNNLYCGCNEKRLCTFHLLALQGLARFPSDAVDKTIKERGRFFDSD